MSNTRERTPGKPTTKASRKAHIRVKREKARSARDAARKDNSQIALSVVERAIGGRLADVRE